MDNKKGAMIRSFFLFKSVKTSISVILEPLIVEYDRCLLIQ